MFVNQKTGDHYSENSLRRIWTGVRKAVGLNTAVQLYDATRHSVASQLVNSGVPLLNVSKLLGHSSTKMTEKYYTHTDMGRLKTDIVSLTLKDQTVTRRKSDSVSRFVSISYSGGGGNRTRVPGQINIGFYVNSLFFGSRRAELQ